MGTHRHFFPAFKKKSIDVKITYKINHFKVNNSVALVYLQRYATITTSVKL